MCSTNFKNEAARIAAEGETLDMLLEKKSLAYIELKLKINAVEVERRVLSYLNRQDKENCDRLFEEVFEINGLPKLDILKRYLRSSLDFKRFKKTHSVGTDLWKRILSDYSGIEKVAVLLREKEEKESNPTPASGRKIGRKPKTFGTGRVMKVASYY